VALRPQASLLEQPVEPPLPLRLWTVAMAAALAVATFVRPVALAIAARWRGITLSLIFFFTLWLAIRVLSLASDALRYIRDETPTWTDLHPLPGAMPPRGFSSSPPATQCWRDRSVSGDCFKRTEPRERVPPHQQHVPRPTCHSMPPFWRMLFNPRDTLPKPPECR
jgi:hypothetical protein